MLEQMRKSSQSLLIYILFGIVIAVFIINFGPQSRGGCEGPNTAGEHYAAKVSGDVISTSDFRYGFLVLGGAQYPANIAKQQRLKETVMDKLIDRELLAQEAERLGFVVTDEEVEDLIAESKMIGLGYPRTVARVQKDGHFNYEAFKNFVQFELSLNPKTFIEEQKRELLASRVRDLIRAGVKVSLDEVKTDFERKGRQVNLEYVRFTARKYESTLAASGAAATPAELASYAKTNEAKLKTLYDQKKFMYEKVPRELHLRQIVIKSAPKTPDAGAGAGKAAIKRTPAAAAALATELGGRLKKGESFAKLAQEISDDAATKVRGGDLGWRRKGGTSFDAATEEKLLAAKTGEVVGPVKTGDGWTLVVSEGSREGDLTFDDVKLDLAAEESRREQATLLAKADAESALAKAKATDAAGKTWKDLFPGPPDDKADQKPDADNGKPNNDKPDKAKPKTAAKPGDSGQAVAAADAPRAEETGLFSQRGGREGSIVEGIGVSNALSKAAFGLTPAAPLAGPFEIADSYVIVRLKERKDPDLAEFEKKKMELQRDAELTKWMEVLTDWSHARCVEAKEARRILINRDQLRYEDSAEPPPYEPCVPRRLFGG
jgi:peptidyl-prolyl cis-trans isomerase D